MKAWLRHDVIAEPLINQWYAWSYLVPPASAARYLTQSQLQVMASFVDAPQVHIAALRDPAMIGGPFIQYGAERVEEIRTLLERTRDEQAALVALSAATAELERLLAAHPPGTALSSLYAQIPAPLRGFVEFVYDARNHVSARYQDGLLYRSEYYRPQNQAIALRRVDDSDRRAFVMSTPRLESDVDVLLRRPFNDAALDALFQARHTAVDIDELAALLQLDAGQRKKFAALFTTTPPRTATRYDGDGVRVRYIGHACVLIETTATAILVDPLVSYEHPTGMARFSYDDLPPFIDYVLITHNHQDHVMLESLLQLRHKIGQIVVPASHRGSLLDPSLRLILKQIGFANVVELDRLDSIAVDDGEIVALPFLGEHGDLDIACKAAWRIELKGRSVLCVADSDNLDDALYDHLAQLFGAVDVLFIGMECEGAPYTWAYGPLLVAPVSHAQAQSRRLNGSNATRGQRLLEKLQPSQVFVYAMGQEPWLNYITSIHYTNDSLAIIESDRLIAECRSRGIAAERLLGKAEMLLEARHAQPRTTKLLAAHDYAAPERTIDSTAMQISSSEHPSPNNDAATSEAARQNAELATLLDDLHTASIQLALDNEALRVNAPKGALTAELTARIKLHKPALQALLRNAGAGNAAPTTPTLPADAQLPDDIRPQSPAIGRLERNILLTGATGFVGAFLLRELLQQTDASIYCLLRDTADAGLERIRTTLKSYGLWQEHLATRIRVISGDLAAPGLGLADADRQWLQDNIDVIYHNGAYVHHLLPYEQLRATNVLGTIDVLRLACNGKTKPLHFVSSLSVLPPPALANGARFNESDPLPANVIPPGGYNRSKWMAEQLVRAAFARGLPGTIHRPGPISGDSRNGAFNGNDFLYRLMRGYLHAGIAPLGEMPIDLLPVDYLAQAIVYLSRHEDARGGTFHLLHPQPVSSDVMFEAIAAQGHALQRVPYADWHRELQRIAREDPRHPLYPLVALFASRQGVNVSEAEELPYDTHRTQSLLAQAPFSLPALDTRLFTTYLNAMQRAGNQAGAIA